MNRNTPPRLACWLIERFTVAADRDAVLGDLTEEFEAHSQASSATARRWYWQQALRSLIPSLRRRWPAPAFAEATAGTPFYRTSSGAPMDTVWQDVRFAVRLSRRKPLVTVVAMLSLIIGISLATVVFAILNAAVLRPLSVASPDELVVLLEQRPTSVQHQKSYPDYLDIRAEQKTMVDVFGSAAPQMVAEIDGTTQVVNGEMVTGGYFDTLGIKTISGRPIGNGDDTVGQPPVAVVSERTWRAWGRSLPLESGATLRLNNATFAVIGIAPASFEGVIIGRRVDVWVPTIHRAIATGNPTDTSITTRRSSWLTVFGRRRPGVTDDVVTSDLTRIEQGIFPKWSRTEPRKQFVGPGSHGDFAIPPSMVATLRVLLIATCVVLVVACANVANLLMARAADRGRELALRLALGASRMRLIRLILIEAVLLCVLSAIAATGVALVGARGAARLMVRFGEPIVLSFPIDWRLTLFVSGLALAAAVLSSIAPAIQVFRSTRLASMADGGRTATGTRLATRLRSVLLAAQFGLSLALVVCALLLVRTVGNLRNAPTGFVQNEVALISVSPGLAQWPQIQAWNYVHAGLDRLSAVPGVRSAAYARVRPVDGGGSRMTIEVPGYTPQPQEDMEINYNTISGAYFDSMGIRLVDGTALPLRPALPPPAPPRTAQPSGPVTPPPLLQGVVNETMARRYWPTSRAVGQRFYLGSIAQGQPVEVIGVAADVKYRDMREEARPSFYVSIAPRHALDGVFHVRLLGSPASTLPALRQALVDLSPAVPITQLRTLQTQIDVNITDDRVAMAIGTVLASAALLLAGIGLFSAMAHMVGQRTKEIGVRVALGATGGGIQRLVLGHALAITLTGAALGLGLAVWATSFTASRLYGVTRFDVVSFVSAALVLAAVAIASALVPARRASRVDPVDALRHD
jgi:predicted permease